MLERSMATVSHGPAKLTDDQLLDEVRVLAERERRATVQLLTALTELDTRRLYLGQGYSSLFTYCTRQLHLSEGAAYRRIEAARAARRFPLILGMLSEGALTLTSVCLLSKHLTPANHRAVLEAARDCTRREVEAQVAALQPKPPVLAFVRKLPTSRKPDHSRVQRSIAATELSLPAAPPDTCSPSSGRQTIAVTPSHVSRLTPLAPDSYRVQLTVSRATHDRLREAQDLMRHVSPHGDLATIVDRALTLLIEDLRKQRWAQTDRPRAQHNSDPRSRHVPASVKREVWTRDRGRCAFVGAAGRCGERGLLELHHVVPFAAGGPTRSDNLELRCRAHNAYEAQQYFGEWMVPAAPH
jgi:hypothetical protein